MTRRFLLAAALCTAATACRLERPGFADSIARREAEAADRAPACGVSDSTTLTGTGIGDLRIGVPADTITRHCHVLTDTIVPGPEGQPSHELHVDLIRDTVIAEIVDDSIWRIDVTGRGFHTRDGYGAGSTLEQLMHMSDLTSISGEGSLFALSPSHCGLSFRLAGPAPVPPSPQSGVKALKHTAGEVRVNKVLIVGCRYSIGPAPDA
jgi:hypothetical protein